MKSMKNIKIIFKVVIASDLKFTIAIDECGISLIDDGKKDGYISIKFYKRIIKINFYKT
jgi:hypothetical protein